MPENETVKLWIKGERYLAQLLTETVTLNGTDWNVQMTENMKGADANGSNRVDLFDFDLLLNSFQKKKGKTGYDYRADFNESSRVDLFDFDILLANFQKKGKAKPQAAVSLFMSAASKNGTTENALNVLNTETAKIAEETLANSMSQDEETQQEEILDAVEQATGAKLKAAKAAESSSSSSGSSSGGGGCNSGFGALAMLFGIPLIFKKKQ